MTSVPLGFRKGGAVARGAMPGVISHAGAPSRPSRDPAVFIPIPWLVAAVVLVALFAAWALFAVNGRNLLPFPDPGSRIYAASSPAAQDAVVALLERHGLRQRFWGNTPGVRRAILWDWTIIACPEPWVVERLDGAAGSLGLVVDDPARRAEEAAAFLRACGFSARVVRDAEPEIPIAFVVTDALRGAALNFRRHAARFPRPQPLAADARGGR